MDSQYHSTSFAPYPSGGQHQSYASLNGMSSQHHAQQDSSSEAPTLPPLHSQNGSYSHLPSLYSNGSHPQTPTTPHTPTTGSLASANTHAYSAYPSPATTGSMPPPSYAPLTTAGYPGTQSMIPNASTATSAAGLTTGTPAQSRLPDLRPMPQANYASPMASHPGFGGSNMLAQQQYMQGQEQEPTHVVGSQGRRGILPSAPGRAAPPTPGTAASTKSMIPAKDADGKFPCPHCNKTYLHAKHLKRHLLRHTGDRPYMCHLCKDTFSRSDILKRHFQKCSIRRGNPTGANHLAHQRRNTNGSSRLSVGNGEAMGLASLPEVAGTSYANGNLMNHMSSSPTVNGDSSYASTVASLSNRSSRANSLMNPATTMTDGRLSMTGYNGIPTLGSNVPNGDHSAASAAGMAPNFAGYTMRQHSMTNPVQPSYGFGTPATGGNYYPGVKAESNPMGYPQRAPHMQEGGEQQNASPVDWTNVFNPSGQDGFMTQSNQNQPQMPVKAESGVENHNFSAPNEAQGDQFFSGLYSHPSAYGEDSGAHHLSGFSNWNMDLVQSNPLQSKAEALLTYVFSNRTPPSDAASDEMRRCLTVDNIKHCVEKFISFQGHWPTIHMPTFNVLEANPALLLTIIVVGSIYSDNDNVYETRSLMEHVVKAVKGASRVYNISTGAQLEGDQPLGSLASDMEEMQALIMLQTVFTWHGNPQQRAAARAEFGMIVNIARRMGLPQPVPAGHPAYSLLHQPGQISQSDLSSWRWDSWIEQEKRARALYALFLLDAALVIFFNNPPQFDPFEIRLPLPADDVAWEARTANECADALGLHGAAAQVQNATGSQRPRQPDMRSAMRSLLDPNYAFQMRATNAYSKFVLVHALHMQIWKVQRANFQQGVMAANGFGGSGPATPLSPNDWVSKGVSNNAGVNTPPVGMTSPSPQTQALLKGIHLALSKWRQCWETDLGLQYPPSAPTPKRFGFSRDAIHFYYLGQSFLRSTNPNDWTAPPDTRFAQVMTLLKKIKGFVVNDNQRNGVEFGSVGEIDDVYGVEDLTLDMKLLFRPFRAGTNSPVNGLQTHLG